MLSTDEPSSNVIASFQKKKIYIFFSTRASPLHWRERKTNVDVDERQPCRRSSSSSSAEMLSRGPRTTKSSNQGPRKPKRSQICEQQTKRNETNPTQPNQSDKWNYARRKRKRRTRRRNDNTITSDILAKCSRKKKKDRKTVGNESEDSPAAPHPPSKSLKQHTHAHTKKNGENMQFSIPFDVGDKKKS